MRTRWIGAIIAAVLFELLCVAAGAEEPEEKHTTLVMIYMCGSDLESHFGAASGDIAEIMASGYDEAFTKVVIMAGGSRKWHFGFGVNTTAIAEVTPRGIRRVWQSGEALNMAEPSTLITFLEYCRENYEAERYALILWDHGGGPNEGTCYDELFGGQSLPLSNLQMALRDSGMPKLSWIGFDACLMATVETAFMMQNYADYLIASQAEEPPEGWNYRFLKGLEEDNNTAATAERVIEWYFKNSKDEEKLTLSCTDLNKIRKLTGAMDSFFDAMYPVLTDETFSELSRERHQTKSFGRAEYNEAADYDLVDLYALTNAGESVTVWGEKLRESLEEAVICSRSNSEGVHGLSVYHPCFNRTGYAEKWAENYEKMFMAMSRNYILYIRRFGQILTGKELGDWRGLETIRNVDADGNIRFSVVLTDEQAEHFEHATLITLEQSHFREEAYSAYLKVWETPYLSLDENNVLSAVYPYKAIYAVDDVTGEIIMGPVEYIMTREGKYQITLTYYDENTIFDPDMITILATYNLDEETNMLRLESLYPYDSVTGEYSPRMAVDQVYIDSQDYCAALYYYSWKLLKAKGEEIPGYQDWEPDPGFHGSEILLPRSFHYEVLENSDQNRDMMFASFQISDTQGVAHSSSISGIYADDYQKCYIVESNENIHTGRYSLSPSAQLYPESGNIRITLDIDGLTENISSARASSIVLNGNTYLSSLSPWANNNTPLIISLPHDSLMEIPVITSVEFDLDLRTGDSSDLLKDHIKLLFPDGVITESMDTFPLAQDEENELIWKLWKFEQKNNGEVYACFTVTNQSEEEKTVHIHDIAIENYAVKTVEKLQIKAGMTVSHKIEFNVEEDDCEDSFITVIQKIKDPLNALGINSISRIRIYYRESIQENEEERRASFLMEEAVDNSPDLNQDQAYLLNTDLLETDSLQIRLGQMQEFWRNGIHRAYSFGLWIENKTDESLPVLFKEFNVDGTETENHHLYYGNLHLYSIYEGGDLTSQRIVSVYGKDEFLPAKSVKYFYVQIEIPEDIQNPQTACFTIHPEDNAWEDIVVSIPIGD